MKNFGEAPEQGAAAEEDERNDVVGDFKSLGADKYGLEYLNKNMGDIDPGQAKELVDMLKKVRPANKETAALQGEIMNELQEMIADDETANMNETVIISPEELAKAHEEVKRKRKGIVKDIKEMKPVSGGMHKVSGGDEDWAAQAKASVKAPAPKVKKKRLLAKIAFWR